MTREEPERFNPIELAVMCQKIADDANVDEPTRQRALELRQVWTILQVPSQPLLKEQKRHEAKLAALKNQMVELLLRF